jgi:cob(I)alamin adenosyltransferase
MPKIYTKTGDKGDTSLLGGKRVSKADLRIEAYGTVDELNAFLGLGRSMGLPKQVDRMVKSIQDDLFCLGAELASPPSYRDTKSVFLEKKDITRLEKMIDEIDGTLPELRKFILPGGHPTAAMLHAARTICRRSERLVVRLSREEELRDIPFIYLNRLSDLLFVLARKINAVKKREEVEWTGRTKKR